jgi:hypothetical protein
MNKEIKCPGENLEGILSLLGLTNFEELDREPSIEDSEIVARVMNDVKEGEEIPKEKIREVYKRTIKIKIKDRRGAEELSAYGRTREEVSGNLREHVSKCYSCSRKYANFIRVGAIMHFRESAEILSDNPDICPPEVLEYAQEDINKGLPALLKEEDERYLGLLK